MLRYAHTHTLTGSNSAHFFHCQSPHGRRKLFLFAIFIPDCFLFLLFIPLIPPSLDVFFFLWSPWVEKQVTINIGTARSSRREAASALKSDRFTRSSAHTRSHTHTCKGYDNAKNTRKHTHGMSDAVTVTTCNMNLSTHRWICNSREKARPAVITFHFTSDVLLIWRSGFRKQLRYKGET